MVRQTLSEKTVAEMVKLRKQGFSFNEIKEKMNVSKWACQKYLRDIPIEEAVSTQQWKQAEEEAPAILDKNGFTTIINLNQLCNAPYWDFYCQKEGCKWLIDITINSTKNLSDKIFRMLDGFKHGILYKNTVGWKLVEINMNQVMVLT